MTDEPVRIEVTLPRPVADVWPAFRDPDLIRQWHGWEDDGARRRDPPDLHRRARSPRRTDRTLHVGGHRFTLEELGAQTIVRVTRTTPLDTEAMDWDAYYDDIDEGWLQLPAAAALRPDLPLGPRRGTPSTSTGGDRLDAAAGGRRARPRRRRRPTPGERYAADVAGEHARRARCGSAPPTSSG